MPFPNVVLFFFSTLLGTTWKMIPNQYHSSVRSAIANNSIEECTAIIVKKDGEWIQTVCIERIIFNNGTKEFCNRWKKNDPAYARCIGVIANKTKNKKLCDEFPTLEKGAGLHSTCVFSDHFFAKELTDYLDKDSKSQEKKSKIDEDNKSPNNPSGG